MAAGRERLVIGAEQFRVLISGKSILAETTHEAKIEVRLSAEVNWRALAHALVDSERLPSIEVSKDGPYRTTGGIVLSDEDGEPAAQNLGASLEHYSLCAAGIRRTSPFAAACIGL